MSVWNLISATLYQRAPSVAGRRSCGVRAVHLLVTANILVVHYRITLTPFRGLRGWVIARLTPTKGSLGFLCTVALPKTHEHQFISSSQLTLNTFAAYYVESLFPPLDELSIDSLHMISYWNRCEWRGSLKCGVDVSQMSSYWSAKWWERSSVGKVDWRSVHGKATVVTVSMEPPGGVWPVSHTDRSLESFRTTALQ